MKPKVDPGAREASEREREIAMRERSEAGERTAAGLSSDFIRFYGRPGSAATRGPMRSMFGMARK